MWSGGRLAHTLHVVRNGGSPFTPQSKEKTLRCPQLGLLSKETQRKNLGFLHIKGGSLAAAV